MATKENWLAKHSAGLFWVIVLVAVLAWSPLQNAYRNHKTTCANQTVQFSSSTRYDPNADVGSDIVTTKGVDGAKYVCTNANGVVVSSTTSSEPINEVHTMGTNTPLIPTPSAPVESTGCAITLCADGSCSNSTGRGTCSHHGGEAN